MTINNEMKKQFVNLLEKYSIAKSKGYLSNASEETVRVWINELLGIFGWNVQDTHQVLQEKQLNELQRKKVHEIGSKNIRPDYTLVNGSVKLCFIDAKNLSVNISSDTDAAFQIRSYGWSIGADFSIVTNFEEIAIYDCKVLPVQNQPAEFARIHYFKLSDFEENFETINAFLCRESIINYRYEINTKTGDSPDQVFALFLCNIRVQLANSIISLNSERQHGYDASLVGLWVQIIINRILFIRVCESRGLEEDGLLSNYANSDFWNEFKKSSYLAFYNHYDGPIFSRIEDIHNLNIDNEIFKELLSFLYYPSPYKFDVMPLKSISDIYDLFLGRRLLITEEGVAIDTLKDEYRRSRGAVITPSRIVKDVINKTMFPIWSDDLSIKEILSLKFLDPACGSGVFLAEVYDFLAAYILNKLQNGHDNYGNIAVNVNDELVLTIEGKKTIINNCLFGVDIDPEAVEVARMSLSLKVIDSYTPILFEAAGLLGYQILNKIGENIKCGNTLVEEDILAIYPDLIDREAELKMTKIFNWKESFKEIFQLGGFDYVIGNPPYVEVKNYNSDLPTMATYIKNSYKTSKNGKIDLSIPFIEKGLYLLNSNGRLGYITQKRFFKTQYGKGIRKYVSDMNLLNSIHDYHQTNLFKDRITYVAILVCDKNTSNNTNIKYTNSITNDIVYIPSNHFDANPWDFSNMELQKIRMRLSNLGKIEDTVHIKVGIQVLWDRAYQIKTSNIDDNLIYGKSGIDDDICIEKGACRSIVCNEEISSFNVGYIDTYAIFPYDIIDGRVCSITFSDFMYRYPLAGKYLNNNRKTIESEVQTLPNINPDLNRDEHWHLYTRVQNHSATYEKVCIPMTAKYPTAVVIKDQNIYCDNANMFFVNIPDSSEIKMYALSAIINSTIFGALARSIANPQQGGYYKFNKQFLDPIPFPKSAFENMSQEIINLSRIAKQIEQYKISFRHATPADTTGLVAVLSTLWQNVDKICDKLYEITDIEREILYSDIRNDR